jgi:hypothetical protein
VQVTVGSGDLEMNAQVTMGVRVCLSVCVCV